MNADKSVPIQHMYVLNNTRIESLLICYFQLDKQKLIDNIYNSDKKTIPCSRTAPFFGQTLVGVKMTNVQPISLHITWVMGIEIGP